MVTTQKDILRDMLLAWLTKQSLTDTLHYLAILSLVASLKYKLKQGQQEPDTQSQAQEEEEAPQVMGLKGVGSVGIDSTYATAGPPLVPQVRQLTGLTELEDGYG